MQRARSEDENTAAPLPNAAPRNEDAEADPKPPAMPAGVAEKVAQVPALIPNVEPTAMASWFAARKMKVHPAVLRAVIKSFTCSRVYSTDEFSMPSVTMQTTRGGSSGVQRSVVPMASKSAVMPLGCTIDGFTVRLKFLGSRAIRVDQRVYSFVMQWGLLVVFMVRAFANELYCPEADQFNIESGDIEFTKGGFTMTGNGRVSSKTSWNLLGGYVEFDMDTTNTQPGIISTFYTTSPEMENCGLECYCDITHPSRPCVELDLVENNGNCLLATTTHTHATDGVTGNRNCDKWGCASKISLPGAPVHMKGTFAQDGKLVVYVDGVANDQYHPLPSNESDAVVVETMERLGAVLVSSQWFSSGWVPGKDDCPAGTKDMLASSKFSISNLRVMGTVKTGPAPPACVSLSPSKTTTMERKATSHTGSIVTSTSSSSSRASPSTSLSLYSSTTTAHGPADEVNSTSYSLTSTTDPFVDEMPSSSTTSMDMTSANWGQGSAKGMLSFAPRLSWRLSLHTLLLAFFASL